MFYQRILRVLNRDADPPDLPDQISGGGGPDPLDAPMTYWCLLVVALQV